MIRIKKSCPLKKITPTDKLLEFPEEQTDWLRLLIEHVVSSFHIEVENLDFTSFDSQGGRGIMWQLFGEDMNSIIDELNEVLAA